MDNLSTIATFDELRRCGFVLNDGISDIEFLRFVRYHEESRQLWLSAVKESKRLQIELDTNLHSLSDLETKLFHARKLLELEKKGRREAERERDLLETKLIQVSELVRSDCDLKEETKDKFAFLGQCTRKRKSTKKMEDKFGNDINSTGSFLSDLSLTQSEDDFLDVKPQNKWKKYRASYNKNDGSFLDATTTANKSSRLSIPGGADKRRSSIHKIIEIESTDKIIAQTTVSIPQGKGPIQAESIIQAIPQPEYKENICQKTPSNKVQQTPYKLYEPTAPTLPPASNTNTKSAIKQQKLIPKFVSSTQHTFLSKTYMKFEPCVHCQRKIRFGSIALKCRECRVCIHQDCRMLFTAACVPQSNGTPTLKGQMGIISDYTPVTSPMVPGLIVHCVNEVETRGLNEVGLYRVPGSEREVKSLKERFLRGKTLPHLSSIDVHVLCGCIKDFLRSLREPLIPTSLWKDFSNAVQNINKDEATKELFIAIDKLPQANRDTLAFLIQHFQRVANCAETKMPISNMAKVFGPTIVGYSSADPDQHAIFTETMIQASVIEYLLNIPTEYWSQFLHVDRDEPIAEPEKDYGSLVFGKILGTPSFRNTTRKERKFYATPPYTTTKKK